MAGVAQSQALHSGLTELMHMLEQDDLSALEKFAELRGPMAGLPQDLLDALEEGLQELDLAAALRVCKKIQSVLEVS
jgi:hypothetical protein